MEPGSSSFCAESSSLPRRPQPGPCERSEPGGRRRSRLKAACAEGDKYGRKSHGTGCSATARRASTCRTSSSCVGGACGRFRLLLLLITTPVTADEAVEVADSHAAAAVGGFICDHINCSTSIGLTLAPGVSISGTIPTELNSRYVHFTSMSIRNVSLYTIAVLDSCVYCCFAPLHLRSPS